MLKLYSFWRSSASYRVRIALNLKGVPYEMLPVNIAAGAAQQYGEAYRALNPQSRVPLLVDGDFTLNQSLAILQYLEDTHRAPALIPAAPRERARMWAFCHTIAGDIQPLQNLGPLAYLTREFGASEEQKAVWLRHWIERGLAALEQELSAAPQTDFVFGASPTLADCVLVPQVYAARRFGCDEAKFPRLARAADHAAALPAFSAAHPDRQPDRP
jgi:maleylacetoacetate isomerase